jgi:hypothetical protein
MKPHRRLIESLRAIAANRPLYERREFVAWLERQPGNVRRAEAAEQLRQYEAAIERAQIHLSHIERPTFNPQPSPRVIAGPGITRGETLNHCQ